MASDFSPKMPTVGEIFFLIVPQLGLMLCHLSISITDIWVASRLDSSIVAALGLVGQVFMVLMLMTSVVSSGCMITIAKAVGAGKADRARRYAFLTLGLAISVGGAVGLIGIVAAPFFLHVLAPNAEVATPLHTFIIAYCCHVPFFYSMVIMNSIFRAHKLAWFPFITLIFVMLVNAVGSVGFGLGYGGFPDYGYAGVAWATFASGLVGAISNFIFLVHHNLLGSCPPWRWVRVGWMRLLRIGGPATLGQVSSQVGTFILMTLLVSLPVPAGGSTTQIVAGMTLGSRIMGILQFPFAAVGMALTICCSHMLGAKYEQGCILLGRRFMLWATLFMIVGASMLFACQSSFMTFFAGEEGHLEAAFAQGRVFLLFACFVAPFQVLSQMQQAVFSGAGVTSIACIASCIHMWLVTVPVAYLLGHVFLWGAEGVYVGMAAGSIIACIYTSWKFYSKAWLAQGRALC